MFMALTQPEQNYLSQRMNLFIALAPITSLAHQTQPGFKTASSHLSTILSAVSSLKLYEIDDGPKWGSVSGTICDIPCLCTIFKGFMDRSSQYND